MNQTRPPKSNKPIRPRGAVPEYRRLIVRRRRDSAIRRLASFGIVR